MQEYDVNIGGITHRVLLDANDAERYGDAATLVTAEPVAPKPVEPPVDPEPVEPPVDEKQAAPVANKAAAKPVNK